VKIAVVGLPRFARLKELIFRQLDQTPHDYVVIEESGRDFIDGGSHALCPRRGEMLMVVRFDEGPLVDIVSERGIDSVVSFSDRGVVVAARVRDCMAMGGNPVAVEEMAVDKAATRQRMLDTGLSRVQYATATLSGLTDALGRIGSPAIVKPRSLGASICVELISTSDQASRYLERCRRNRVFKDGQVVIEKYLAGPELSVEGIVVGGKAHFYGITETHHSGPPFFVGTGHDFFPSHERAEEIYAYTQRVITAMGMWQSPFHIELKAIPGEPLEVIEVHTRFGGGMIMELVHHGIGVPAFADYLQVVAGQPPAEVGSNSLLFCEELLCVPSGRVERIEVGSRLADHPALLHCALDLRAGDAIEADVVPVEYAGYVLFRANDREDAAQLRRMMAANFCFDVR
jgi:hypothetical protein